MKKHKKFALVGAVLVLGNLVLFTKYQAASVFPFLDKPDGVKAEKSIDAANASLDSVTSLAGASEAPDKVSNAFSAYLSHQEDTETRLSQQSCGTGSSTWPNAQYGRIQQRLASLNYRASSVLRQVAAEPPYQTPNLTTAAGTTITLSEQLAAARLQSAGSLHSCPAYAGGHAKRGLGLSVGTLIYVLDTAVLSLGFLFGITKLVPHRKTKKSRAGKS